MRKYKVALGALVLCFIAFMAVPLARAESTAAISQGFQADSSDLEPGAIVSLVQSGERQAQLANTSRADRLIGVISENSLLAISDGTAQVQVVTSGVTPTLVSNINGDVVTGDKIAISPINGVGMKATASAPIVGTVQQDFKDIQPKELTISDKNGKSQVIKVGLLAAQINVSYYVAPQKEETTFLPAFIQQIANAVAGHEVSVARVLLSLLVLLLGFMSAGILLYSSVQSSIISIGRNPLSEGAVQKSLLRVGLTAFGILLVMAIAIYLILRI